MKTKPTLTLLLCIGLAGLMGAGCKTTPSDPFADIANRYDFDVDSQSLPLCEISPLFNTLIPSYEVKDVSVSKSLRVLEQAWKKEANVKELPVSLSASPQIGKLKITFTAKDIRVRDALYLIAKYCGSADSQEGSSAPIQIHNKVKPQPKRPMYLNRMFRFRGFDAGALGIVDP